MSKYRYEMGGIIRDTEIDFPYYTDEIVELLDEKDQRISELEEQLKNARKEMKEIVVVDCYNTELERIINDELGGWENILEIKTNRGGDNVPYCLIIAKKTEQNKNTKRVNTR